MISSIQRMKEFKEFLIKRNPSKKFADKYATYLTSNVIKTMPYHYMVQNPFLILMM